MSRTDVAPLPLHDVATRAAPGRRLSLDGNLVGPDAAACIAAVLQPQDGVIVLECGSVPVAGEALLSFRGRTESLTWVDQALLEVCLIGEGATRAVLLKIGAAEGADAGGPLASLLAQTPQDDALSSWRQAGEMFFSSTDGARWPSGADRPLQQGLNFDVRLDTGDEMLGLLAAATGSSRPGPLRGVLGLEPAPVGPRPPCRQLTLGLGDGIRVDVGALSLSLDAHLTSRIDEDEDPVLSMHGTMTVGATRWGTVRATLDWFDGSLAIECVDLPTLGDLLAALPANGPADDGARAGWFKDHLDVRPSRLGLVIDADATPADERVRELRIGLETARPVTLVERVLTVEPTLDLRVTSPLSTDERSIEGRIAGRFVLLDTLELCGAIAFPSGRFIARSGPLPVAQTLEALGLGLDSVEFGGLADILKRTRVRVLLAGHMQPGDHAIEASMRLRVAPAAGATGWHFERVTIGIDCHGPDAIGGWMAGRLLYLRAQGDPYGFDFGAEFDPEDGLSLRAGTSSVIDLSQLAGDLLEGLRLPASMPAGLKLTDVGLWVNPGDGSFRIAGRTAQQWVVLEAPFRLAVELEYLRFERSGTGIAADVVVALTIADVGIRLSATGQGEDWTFTGSAEVGHGLSIGALVESLGTKLGMSSPLQAPSCLRQLTLRRIAMQYRSLDQALQLACEGSTALGDTPVSFLITIAVNSQGVVFGGHVVAGGACFDLEAMAANAGPAALRATWRGAAGSPGALRLRELHAGLPALPGLEAWLAPTHAELLLASGDKGTSVDLRWTTQRGRAALKLARPAEAAPVYFALALQLPKVSTEDLGALGSALKPHALVLDGLEIVAASAALPEGQSFGYADDRPVEVAGGARLRGGLGFEGTGAPIPFECRIGGSPAAPPAAAAAGRPPGEVNEVETPALDGAGNNVPIGRHIGPLSLRKARIEARDDRIHVGLEASIGAGPVQFDLDGLDLSFPMALLDDPVAHAGDIRVALEGLGIQVSQPPLTMAGGFSRRQGEAPYVGDVYDGRLVIGAQGLRISVLGRYGSLPVGHALHPSMFLYGAYDGVIGGPAAFFVTGLALGGGYNTRLAIPPVEAVATFPLVQAVVDPARFEADALREAVVPSLGDHWLAAGVRFDSFKMADSFALLSVSFGNRLQFALLGLTRIGLPAGAARDQCAVYAELAIRGVLDPAAGVFGIEGRLTPNSFLFSSDLRLVGGFAFYVWFGDSANAGDFVISLGGYHPRFPVPSHYPVVPRVGVRGQVSPRLSFSGEAYFAITPSCVMAGLRLQAAFSSPQLTATFVACADFLIGWAPFHYRADLGISISIVLGELQGVRLEVGAALSLSGPPLAGIATVTVGLVSLTIEFGQPAPVEPLEWPGFCRAFLPAGGPQQDCGPVATTRIGRGLLREVRDAQGTVTHRVVNAHELTIETDSVVPCTAVRLARQTRRLGGATLGVRPAGIRRLHSLHLVIVRRASDGARIGAAFEVLQWPTRRAAPALWSPDASPGLGDAVIDGVPAGVVLRARPAQPASPAGPFDLVRLALPIRIPKKIAWSTAGAPPQATATGSLPTATPSGLRAVRECLARTLPTRPDGSGWPWNDVGVDRLWSDPLAHLQALPRVASLGAAH